MRTAHLTPVALTAALLILGVAAAAAKGPSKGDKAPAKSDVVEVNIKKLTLIPETVTIKVGQTVRWTNNDDRDYLLVARDQSFKSPNLRPKEKFEHKFTKAGTFEYSCALHPRLIGTVIVEDKK